MTTTSQKNKKRDKAPFERGKEEIEDGMSGICGLSNQGEGDKLSRSDRSLM